MKRKFKAAWTTGAMLACFVAHGQQASMPLAIKIDAQPVGQALRSLAQQTGIQLLVDSEAIPEGAISPTVDGSFTLEDVLQKLLSGTPLEYDFINARTVSIRGKDENRNSAAEPLSDTRGQVTGTRYEPVRLAQSGAAEESAASLETQGSERASGDEPEAVKLEEVVVTGSHIRGVQNLSSPVITFDREDIEKRWLRNHSAAHSEPAAEPEQHLRFDVWFW